MAQHLYAHIPFCEAKCPYCAFVVHVGSRRLISPYLAALKAEATSVGLAHPGGPLRTVYFGGGTPSLVDPTEIAALLETFRAVFGLEPEVEVTLEAHPSTVDAERLGRYRAAGVTRVSFGGETMRRSELARIGRNHAPADVMAAMANARAAGFDSVNVDLMYGLPGQTVASFEASIRAVLASGPDHMSLYPLSIELGTVFARDLSRGRLQLPTDERVVRMYHAACELLGGERYDHYEIANWALPGKRCRHNLAVWRNESYYGLGVGAHGYLRPYRTENVRQTSRYLRAITAQGTATSSRERIDDELEARETVMLGLRLLQDGLDLDALRRSFGLELVASRKQEIDRLSAAGMVRSTPGTLHLTETAVPVANEVIAALM